MRSSTARTSWRAPASTPPWRASPAGCARTRARAASASWRGAAGLSPSHLSRLFKAQTGVSITRFRNQRRLERFRALYGDGRRTTALAAALDAGFGSYAQFYRVVRAETARSPSGLRAASQAGAGAAAARTRAREEPSASSMKITSAAHTSAKPARRDSGIGSP